MKPRLFRGKNHLLFIAPGFVLYSLFVILPIFYVIYLSVFNWSGLGKMAFVGFDNFKTLFFGDTSQIFWNAIKNNIKYLLCVWFLITPIQFLLAYLFFIKIPFYRYFRFLIFMPYVISSVIVSFFATIIFNPNIGILNNLLSALGLSNMTSAWLGDPNRAFGIMLIIIIWQSAATGMMIFYANMIDIPAEIMEASSIDGCTEWKRLLYILLPLSLPSCASIIVMSSIWALAIFDIPFILGGPNGGVNNSLDFANLVFYRYTFGNVLDGRSNLGFGAAISVTMFVIMMLVVIVQNKVLSRFDYER